MNIKDTNLSENTIKQLIKSAIDARKNAYTPYLEFQTGAAILTKEDKIFTGCNIQSAVLSPNICAERTAIFKAVSEGYKDFKAIAVVGGSIDKGIEDYCPPCGICRQVMLEFCDPDTFYIILAKSENDFIIYSLAELSPLSFSAKSIN